MAFELFALVWIWLAFEWRARCTSPVSPPSSHPFPMQRSECSADATEIIMMLCKHCRRHRRHRRHRRRPTLRSYCTEEGGRKEEEGRRKGKGELLQSCFWSRRQHRRKEGRQGRRRRGCEAAGHFSLLLSFVLAAAPLMLSPSSEEEKERGNILSAFPFRNLAMQCRRCEVRQKLFHHSLPLIYRRRTLTLHFLEILKP